MNIQENVKLNALTTFGTGGLAKYFVDVATEDDLVDSFDFAIENGLEVFVLGSGSNIVFSDKGFDGLIIKMSIKGIDFVNSNKENQVLVRAAAGEVWDDVVGFAVKNGFWGIENLSSIPGTAGAFAVQNVGAYGQEAAQVVYSVRVFDRQSKDIFTLEASRCQFSYRSSIFNSTEKGRYIILETTLCLHANPQPMIEYPDLIAFFAEKNISNPSLSDIRNAVVEIRLNKFPDWHVVGTAGSFFKNLYLTNTEYSQMYEKIKEKCPEVLEDLDNLKNKFQSDSGIKIPTAFLIDKICKLKGTSVGGACISETQALAILNPEKKAISDDVKSLIDLVRSCVYDYTGQMLEVEPDLVGFSS